MKSLNSLLRFVLALAAIAVLAACDSEPKTYDDRMLQASRTGKSDRQFRKLTEECKEKFSAKTE